MESKNILKKTRAIVIGPMEECISEGRDVRLRVKKELDKMGVTLLDHYDRPFVEMVREDEDTHNDMVKMREEERYDDLADLRLIRLQDLALIDMSDFVICHFEKKTFSVGTFEELFLANKIKKPIFFVWGEGKQKCPFWVFWTIPHRYIYNSIDEVIEMLHKINNGEVQIDSKRWRLLKPEYR